MSAVLDPLTAEGTGGSGDVRRRRRRFGERVTLGHVAPVVLAVLAGVFVLAGLRDRSATVSVPVASQVIPAGAAVNGSDTRLVRVHHSEGGLLAGLFPRAELTAGWVAASRIDAGDPISLGSVARPTAGGSGLGSMSIPVAADLADGGDIMAGDVVDVTAPSTGGGAVYVATGLRVLSVASTKTAGVLGDTGTFYVVVAVDRPTALRIAAAVGGSSASGSTSGGVEVIRSTGEATATQTTSRPVSPATPAGSTVGGGDS